MVCKAIRAGLLATPLARTLIKDASDGDDLAVSARIDCICGLQGPRQYAGAPSTCMAYLEKGFSGFARGVRYYLVVVAGADYF